MLLFDLRKWASYNSKKQSTVKSRIKLVFEWIKKFRSTFSGGGLLRISK